jgi:hypothetical protein
MYTIIRIILKNYRTRWLRWLSGMDVTDLNSGFTPGREGAVSSSD